MLYLQLVLFLWLSGHVDLLDAQDLVAVHKRLRQVATNVGVDLVLIPVVADHVQVFHQVVLFVGAQVLFVELVHPAPEHVRIPSLVLWPQLLVDFYSFVLVNFRGRPERLLDVRVYLLLLLLNILFGTSS